MRKEPIAALGLFAPIYPPKEGSWEPLGFRNPLDRQVPCLSPLIFSPAEETAQRNCGSRSFSASWEEKPGTGPSRQPEAPPLPDGLQRPVSHLQSGQHPGAASISDPCSRARQALRGWARFKGLPAAPLHSGLLKLVQFFNRGPISFTNGGPRGARAHLFRACALAGPHCPASHPRGGPLSLPPAGAAHG